MTDTTLSTVGTVRPVPPLSRAIQLGVATCLILGGLLNGGLQYADHLLAGDPERRELLVWGLEHHAVYQAVWFGVMLSSVCLLLGLLGLAQITRWRAPRLTAVATVLTVLGMWGFGNVLAGTYVAHVVVPDVLGVDAAVTLVEDGYLKDWGMVAGSLVPHLVGSFFGVLLLAVACWRAGLPKVPAVLLIVFLVWDFALSPIGIVEPHVLLLVALVWLGVAVARMPQREWLGQSALPADPLR
ncbi:hypothetical protein FE697_017740 [Mumia zhuanghuii]|uniref:DUF4386 family protein n=2 Tax=Mumia TaxID=1546255 RepID=A0ABW1QM51_9ACTN|nr:MULTISPECIES: hypothetical protein [Mumia]KAA1419753.1 hypothetical protein FE697_017740 [Mumia zhuanghuii]